MQSKNLRDRLIKVERTINVYNNLQDEPVEEINIDNIPFEIIKEIVTPKDDDPLMYDGYKLSETEIEKFNNYLTEKIQPHFNKSSYFLICGGIYDWGLKR